jgi:hypothetical protein
MRHYNSIQIIVSHCFCSLYRLLSLIHDIIKCNLFDCTLRVDVCVHSGEEKSADEKKEKGEGGSENVRCGRGTLRRPLENSPKNLFLTIKNGM